MKVLNSNKQTNVKVGDVIKYWDKTDPYPRYAMIIRYHEQGYSAVILSDKRSPNLVGQVLLDGAACQFGFATPKFLWNEPKRGWVETATESIQRYTSDSPTAVYQKYCQKWDHVEKVPFFGVEGYPEDYEAGEQKDD